MSRLLDIDVHMYHLTQSVIVYGVVGLAYYVAMVAGNVLYRYSAVVLGIEKGLGI